MPPSPKTEHGYWRHPSSEVASLISEDLTGVNPSGFINAVKVHRTEHGLSLDAAKADCEVLRDYLSRGLDAFGKYVTETTAPPELEIVKAKNGFIVNYKDETYVSTVEGIGVLLYKIL